MITQQERTFLLKNAYVPEHSVDLMRSVSGGEPFLRDGFFFCKRGDWAALVGYPLGKPFDDEELSLLVQWMGMELGIQRISIAAPRLPQFKGYSWNQRQQDDYYTLEPDKFEITGGVQRLIRRAKRELSVERSCEMNEAHRGLSEEFARGRSLPQRIRVLLERLPLFVEQSPDAVLLSAWNHARELVAFYVIDLAPERFSTYVMGCHSRKRHVPGASDLLMQETIDLALQHNKQYIHLGLGVNEGVRRFKEKWGARPTLHYDSAELVRRKTPLQEILQWTQITKHT
jgi:hypothetical protein